ncbi:hypothetical protein DC909_02975 [Vibrio parahaemolyticus]|nr:hypothetical protein [Vibrio parahaemolyticus]
MTSPIENIECLAKQICSTAFLVSTHADIQEDESNVFWLISGLAEQIKTEASRISINNDVKK